MTQPPTWLPSASIDILRQRSFMMNSIRSFFIDRGYWEPETPIMGRYGVTDVYLSNIKATFRNTVFHLQTSPEYHMKRLLAAGSGAIFQLSRVFRDDELGRWHNPEFTLLEWYQLHVDHHALMAEVNELLQLTLKTNRLIKMTYHDAFLNVCGINPHVATWLELKDVVDKHGLKGVLDDEESDCDMYLFLLMSHVVEPALASYDEPVAVYDFPRSQASLAKINHNVAERFEVYYRGVELANGFHELTDAAAQNERFSHDNVLRANKGLEYAEPDAFLLEALQAGMPPCSGVALGIDRLCALAFSKSSISECLAFDVMRA